MPLVPVWDPKTHKKHMVHSVDAREMAANHGFLTYDPNGPQPEAAPRPLGLTDEEWEVILIRRGKLKDAGAAQRAAQTAADAASGKRVAPNGQPLETGAGAGGVVGNAAYPRDGEGKLIVDDMDLDMLRAWLAEAGIQFHPNAKEETLRKRVAEALETPSPTPGG